MASESDQPNDPPPPAESWPEQLAHLPRIEHRGHAMPAAKDQPRSGFGEGNDGASDPGSGFSVACLIGLSVLLILGVGALLGFGLCFFVVAGP